MTRVEHLMPYLQAAALLRSYGIPLAPARLAHSAAEAVKAARTMGYPLVLKAISPALTHKSDAGLVRLDLSTAAEVEAAAQALLAGTAGYRLEGLLLQKMVQGGTEMIVGLSSDPQFGPVIALGAGGVLVELLDDVALRLPPLTHRQAMQMIREVRAWRLLRGYRHQVPADVEALAQLLVDISRLALKEAGRVASLDLNPVIVRAGGQGVRVVDFRVIVQASAKQER
jgi:acyl-CoA synthetase (NDP forming)